MTSRLHNTKTKKSSDTWSFSNAVSQADAFNSRPFVMQTKTTNANNTHQTDLKTSLKRAEKYGHNPNQILSADISSNATPIQPKMGMEQSQVIQAAFKLPKLKLPWKKKKTNTPVAQTPSAPAPPDWSNLAQNEFKPGDKLYGIASARPQGAVKNAAANKANVIDQLNNQFLGTSFIGPNSKQYGETAKNNPTDPAGKQWMDIASYGKPNKMVKEATTEQKNEAVEYKTWLEKHPKYSPTTTDVRGEPLSSPFRQWDRTKKSSKAGLEYTTKEKQNNVHFVLDGLNQKAVVNKLDHKTMGSEQKINPKTGDSQQSITASELRSLYRKQGDQDMMKNTQFWEAGQKVDAPWKTNPALWANYKPKSWQKRFDPTLNPLSSPEYANFINS
ncbi:hypothetical protein [Nostoc sp. UHCC 0251]|uniref:hypothetical protein n=1 Tax=Nostoc sp. UHCC 0251 TaxID=3110240 RepID=UPI002B21467D|nr:hypothetical protein [Nostoc sp. UHCC 0251]MEA5626571.1 hypothetical protein [Nostoc sp. UHCC 0251]